MLLVVRVKGVKLYHSSHLSCCLLPFNFFNNFSPFSLVKLFGYGFDKIAINFRKDILVTEAHRHPYLDRIGGMYLMRHAYGHNFVSNAGARWRQLFCVALMPWLKKYRSLRNLERVLEEKAAASLVVGSSAPGLTVEEMAQLSAFRQRREALLSTKKEAPKRRAYPSPSQRGEFMASF